MRLLLCYIIFIPIFSNAPIQRVEGICGPADQLRMNQVGATWRHNWSLCTDERYNPSGPGAECVSWVQSRGQYSEAAILAELEAWGCPSGWIGFGDEWTLQAKPLADQRAELDWFAELVGDRCKVVFGGYLTWHPYIGDANLALLESWGELPDNVGAIAVDHYDWTPTWDHDWQADAEAYAELVEGMGLELWARETGNLLGTDEALATISELDSVTVYFDRWAWFTSYAPGWDDVSAFDAEWQLTEVGAALKE